MYLYHLEVAPWGLQAPLWLRYALEIVVPHRVSGMLALSAVEDKLSCILEFFECECGWGISTSPSLKLQKLMIFVLGW